jgi:uncharacterized membrane protein
MTNEVFLLITCIVVIFFFKDILTVLIILCMLCSIYAYFVDKNVYNGLLNNK